LILPLAEIPLLRSFSFQRDDPDGEAEFSRAFSPGLDDKPIAFRRYSAKFISKVKPSKGKEP
jgi:hypothetical protein